MASFARWCFVQRKAVLAKKELWWYPYSDKVYKQTLKMMRWIFR